MHRRLVEADRATRKEDFMRTSIFGILLTLGLACLGANAASAAPASGTAIGQAADSASIVDEVRRVVRRRCCGVRRVRHVRVRRR